MGRLRASSHVVALIVLQIIVIVFFCLFVRSVRGTSLLIDVTLLCDTQIDIKKNPGPKLNNPRPKSYIGRPKI